MYNKFRFKWDLLSSIRMQEPRWSCKWIMCQRIWSVLLL